MVNPLTNFGTIVPRTLRALSDLLYVATQRAVRIVVAVLVVACMSGGAAWATERVVVRADDSGQLAGLLDQTLNMPADTIGDPRSAEFVDRARIERDRLTDVLRGLGYYAGEVEVRVGDAPLFSDLAATDAGVQDAGAVTFVATPGPVYRIRSFRMVQVGPAGDAQPANPVDDVVGLPATAETLANVEERWRSLMRDVGHPFADGIKRSVVPDHAAQVVDVVLEVALGPVVRLGQVRFLGLLHIDPEQLRPLVSFKPGERYQAEKLLALQTALEQQPQIESATVHLSAMADASGSHPVTVTVVETPVKGPAGPIDGLIGIAVLGAAATSVAVVQVSRARTGDASPWRSHWYFYLIAVLLVVSGAMVGLRVMQFLG
jgi:hypothetical protein